MQYRLRHVGEADWHLIARIFNYYVETSFAAYPDKPVGADFFKAVYHSAPEYPFFVAETGARLAGFGYLSPIRRADTLRSSGMLTYFLSPAHTGCGLGTRLLEALMAHGRKMGVTNYLAHVSSLNENSLRFHEKRGFKECGRFHAVGRKFGRPFDMVWLQRQSDERDSF